jgi:hypothetical protein
MRVIGFWVLPGTAEGANGTAFGSLRQRMFGGQLGEWVLDLIE